MEANLTPNYEPLAIPPEEAVWESGWHKVVEAFATSPAGKPLIFQLWQRILVAPDFPDGRRRYLGLQEYALHLNGVVIEAYEFGYVERLVVGYLRVYENDFPESDRVNILGGLRALSRPSFSEQEKPIDVPSGKLPPLRATQPPDHAPACNTAPAGRPAPVRNPVAPASDFLARVAASAGRGPQPSDPVRDPGGAAEGARPAGGGIHPANTGFPFPGRNPKRGL